MPTPKELKSRILAVQNTKKITKTMEMVATAKAKKAIDRVNQFKKYSEKITEMVGNIGSSRVTKHSLLKRYEPVTRVGILIITANRGLCGGFNNNLLKLAQTQIQSWKEKKIETELHLIGKKAINYFKFMNIPFYKGHTLLDDNIDYEEASNITEYFLEEFIDAKQQYIEIVSTGYFTAALQKPKLTPLLPLEIALENSAQDSSKKQKDLFIFEPSARDILNSLLPKVVQLTLFRCLIESAASEQIARRIAMKNATENASEIIRNLNLKYNRVRQAKITQEIAELVGGAAAIE